MAHLRRQCILHVVRSWPPYSVTNEYRTERHFNALFGVEDDRRVILATVTSEHYIDQTALTLYGILDNGTEDVASDEARTRGVAVYLYLLPRVL